MLPVHISSDFLYRGRIANLTIAYHLVLNSMSPLAIHWTLHMVACYIGTRSIPIWTRWKIRILHAIEVEKSLSFNTYARHTWLAESIYEIKFDLHGNKFRFEIHFCSFQNTAQVIMWKNWNINFLHFLHVFWAASKFSRVHQVAIWTELTKEPAQIDICWKWFCQYSNNISICSAKPYFQVKPMIADNSI